MRLNRDVMERLINVTMFLGGCDNGFRGHDESSESENRGGYKELLRLALKITYNAIQFLEKTEILFQILREQSLYVASFLVLH